MTSLVDVSLREDGCCWVCQEEDNPEDLFYPCNCQLHRKCIKQWVDKVKGRQGIGWKEEREGGMWNERLGGMGC